MHKILQNLSILTQFFVYILSIIADITHIDDQLVNLQNNFIFHNQVFEQHRNYGTVLFLLDFFPSLLCTATLCINYSANQKYKEIRNSCSILYFFQGTSVVQLVEKFTFIIFSLMSKKQQQKLTSFRFFLHKFVPSQCYFFHESDCYSLLVSFTDVMYSV